MVSSVAPPNSRHLPSAGVSDVSPPCSGSILHLKAHTPPLFGDSVPTSFPPVVQSIMYSLLSQLTWHAAVKKRSNILSIRTAYVEEWQLWPEWLKCPTSRLQTVVFHISQSKRQTLSTGHRAICSQVPLLWLTLCTYSCHLASLGFPGLLNVFLT